MTVYSGLARLAMEGSSFLDGRRIGLICNQSAVDADLGHAIDPIAARVDLKLAVLFGPEHGVRGDAQDMAAVDGGRDARSGLPVYSLYGATEASLTPTAEMLDQIDVLLFDVQDVGSRYYTFVWTMVLAMRACAKAGKAFVVLDRPNPLGGVHIEGGGIAPGFRIVRGPGLVHEPPRPDGRRDRALAPRDGEARSRARRDQHAQLAARPAVRAHGAAVGDAVAEHADARHGAGLPGDVPGRGYRAVGGARHHAAVRAGGRAAPRWPPPRARTSRRCSCRAWGSGRPCSRRCSASTPARRAAACSST